LLKNKDIITMGDHLKKMKNAMQTTQEISMVQNDIIKLEEDKIKTKNLKDIIIRDITDKIEEKRSKIIESLDSDDPISSSDSDEEYNDTSDDD